MNDMPIGLRFSIIHRNFRKRMDDRLKELDLTGVQMGVIVDLEKLERHGCCEINQHMLERSAHVTHPTMTDILKRLEKKGYVRCTVNPADKRSKLIHSTEKCALLAKEMRESDDAVFSELCSGLSEEQQAQLMDITELMLKNVCKGCEDRE